MTEYITMYIEQQDKSNYNEFNKILEHLPEMLRQKFPTVEFKIIWGSDSLDFKDVDD